MKKGAEENKEEQEKQRLLAKEKTWKRKQREKGDVADKTKMRVEIMDEV